MSDNTAKQESFTKNAQSELDKKKDQTKSSFKESAKEIGAKTYRATLHTVDGVGRISLASARVIILTMIGVFAIEAMGLGLLAGLGIVVAGGAALIYLSRGLLEKQWDPRVTFA